MSIPRMLRKTATAAVLLLGCAAITVTIGCTAGGRSSIPTDADRLASGEGRVTATATRDGDLWILDDNDNKIVWSGKVQRDDEIVIDPADNRIRVGGNTVGEPALAREHRYVIYLRR